MTLGRDCYRAYESGDRRVLERRLTDDFRFYSPADVGIDRSMYFVRCWPNAELIEAFEFKRLVEAGDEVIVTYESKKTDGSRFRNTEVLTFDGDHGNSRLMSSRAETRCVAGRLAVTPFPREAGLPAAATTCSLRYESRRRPMWRRGSRSSSSASAIRTPPTAFATP